MADVFLPRQQPFMPAMNPIDHDRIDHSMPQASSLAGPPPNPPFIFPMQPEPAPQGGTVRPELMAENTSNRRSKTRSRPQQLSISRLPDFDFPASSASSETSFPHTPSSPSKSRMIPPQQGGHRRNGSEFIGGDGKSGLTGLMSTSPTKGDGILPPPPGARAGPSAGRRGHAHRRSGAVSSHDVSAIIKPAPETRSGSAPSSPCDPYVQFNVAPSLDRSISQPTTTSLSQDFSRASHNRRTSSSTGPTRPRVGFSDHVEYIPRPLSTISSETSSSLSTIRPSHSVTGSISSIISNGNASPPNIKAARIPSWGGNAAELASAPRLGYHTDETTSTSQAILPLSISKPVALESGNPSDLPSWSDVFGSPPTGRKTSSPDQDNDTASILRLSGAPDAIRSRRRPVSLNNPTLTRPRTSPEPKVLKRQKKMKTWAGSILARKARESTQEVDLVDKRSPSTPPASSGFSSDISLEDLNFDDDTSCVIQAAPSPIHRPLPMNVDSSPRFDASSLTPDTDVDESTLVLDLDAALGTPSASSQGPTFDEITGSRSAAAQRRLHSSGATGGFDGPGMHYRRRAESAPEMTPINCQIFGSARLGSNSAMADVFEEDEEDETEHQTRSTRTQKRVSTGDGRDELDQGLGVTVVDAANNTGTLAKGGSKNPIVTSSDSKHDYSLLQRGTPDSTTPAIDQSHIGIIDIVSADEEPRAPESAKALNESTVTPTSASDRLVSRPASAPMQYTLPQPSPAFAVPEIHSSALSTPDFRQTSFEGPRLHTATSSITDRATLSSFRAGDHGFDTRGSVDDVPSLTSSASTMASAYPPRISSSAPTRASADRPSSLSSVPIVPRTCPSNASKRSSLASLSRLVGGSSGGRSKLNLSESAAAEESQKTEKKRGKRISRLMRFWKPKEKVALS
ncbi:MAG: hypothetical protein Q9186_000814 [Xanthomendoza sp. 1 TL-2023]